MFITNPNQSNLKAVLVPCENTSQFDITNKLTSRLLIDILNRTVFRTAPWGALLVTSCKPDVSPFIKTLWALPFSLFFTKHSVYLLTWQLESLSRRMLWGRASKAWLKSRKTSFTAYCSSTNQVTLSQKDIKSVRQEFPFMNLCWLCLMSALPFKCLSIAPSVIFSVFFQVLRLD